LSAGPTPRPRKYDQLILWIIPSAVRNRFSLDFPTELPTTSRGFDTVVIFVDHVVHIAAATKIITSESLSDHRVTRYQRVPETDGPTKHAKGVPEYTLRHFVGAYQSNCDKLLPAAEFVVNNSVHVSFGHTPFMLNYRICFKG
jgi:hypothetical protein